MKVWADKDETSKSLMLYKYMYNNTKDIRMTQEWAVHKGNNQCGYARGENM